MRAVLEMVARFRKDDDLTPIVLMGYLNSVLAMGEETFAEAAAEAGVDGLIMVNLPPEEAGALRGLLKEKDIDLIFLVAPTTTPERAALITEQAGGFVYYVSLKGITGADNLETGSVSKQVGALKQMTELPVLVGFGIKDGGTARAVAEKADGVVVGSALVRTMAGSADALAAIPALLTAQLAEIRRALDA